MKSQIKYILIFSFLLSSFSRVSAQPKLSIDLGLGLYQPSLDGFDDNTAFPAKAFLNRNLLLNYGVYYEFFSNARIGYNTFSSFDTGELVFDGFKGAFTRTIHYRVFALETFFRWKPKIELNFTLSPVWGRGSIQVDTKPSDMVDDWNELLNSFGDDSPLNQVASDNAMVADWFGYSGMLGYRYYIRPWIGIDFKMGFLNNNYKKDRWRFQGKKVKGPDMKIDDIPIFTLKVVYALK